MSNIPAGTLDLEKIKDSIYDWVYSVTANVLTDEGQIVWRQQSEPLPARPCVTLKFIDGPRPIARQGNLFLNPGENFVSYGIQMEATLSVQVFGNTSLNQLAGLAMQLALDLNSSLMRQSILDMLKLGGVAVQVVGSPKNLTALEESRYEERAGFDITLGMAQNIVDTPDTIGSLNLGGSIGQGQIPHPISKHIVIP